MKISIGQDETQDFLWHLSVASIAVAAFFVLTIRGFYVLAIRLLAPGDAATADLLLKGSDFEYMLVTLILFYLVSCIVLRIFYRFAGRDRYFRKSILVFTVIYALCGVYILPRLSSWKEASARVIFLAENRRPMSGREVTLYKSFGDTRLVDKEYCTQVGGNWFASHENCDIFSANEDINCFPFCIPPTQDGGRECDTDADCESYCKTDAETSRGKCYGYLIDDRDPSGRVQRIEK